MATEMDDRGRLHFDQIVFSGGGTRCFWHGGFMEVVGPHLARPAKRISAVSGGALSAAARIADRESDLLSIMGERLEARQNNLSIGWDEFQENGLTPHQQLYSDVVDALLDDEALARIADGPSFQVLLSRPPHDKLPELSTAPMMAAYEADLVLRSTPHVVFPNMLGAEEELVDARQAARDGNLQKLICSAAVIPPVFNVEGWEGRPVVDGGMANKAPVPDPDEGETLILLTRKFRNLPEEPARYTYIEPSKATPADKIDFTDREKIEKTWQQGREDGQRFLDRCCSAAKD